MVMSPKSFRLEIVLDRVMILYQYFTSLFYAVINVCLQKEPGNGINILFNTKAKPVGNREQMIDQTLVPDLECRNE